VTTGLLAPSPVEAERGRAPLTVHIVHPGNPYSPDPDGIVSVQRNFMRAGPESMRSVYWGVDRRGVRVEPEDRWRFRPVLSTKTQRPLIPLSLKFSTAMAQWRRELRSGILRFDRFEAAAPLLASPLPKVLFLHTQVWRDIRNTSAGSRWRGLGALHDRLFRRVLERMDRVYFLLPEIGTMLEDGMPWIAPRMVPFSVPVDLSRFRPMEEDERARTRAEVMGRLGIERHSRLVLFAGRLEGEKRPLVIPEIAAALEQSVTNSGAVHFLIAGTGTLADRLRESAARRAPGRVHLLGSVPQEQLARFLAAADALILPSVFESLPNVVLESLASGTPVVATASAGRTAEILTMDGAGLAADGDPQALASALQCVLAWNGAAARRCRQTAERFRPDLINEPIYDDLAALAGTPRPA
jgi:glycosyltransferase involved in cell wall biosynthesis